MTVSMDASELLNWYERMAVIRETEKAAHDLFLAGLVKGTTHRMPSWVMTCMTWPSIRMRARCPASVEPTWMTWLPRVMIPAVLTSRWTSTQLVAARALGAFPARGGPAGRAPCRPSLAKSTAASRRGFIRHPEMLRWTVVVSSRASRTLTADH